MSDQNQKSELLNLTTSIVSSYLSKNAVEINDIPGLIREVFSTLSAISNADQAAEKPQPIVPIKKSVQPDFIVCLEDGKKLKMLKRHLKTAYNMSPEEYRQRWGLPSDYPMVAPNYASQRRILAKKIGLGTSRRKSSK